MSTSKPRVFIASSTEGLIVARAINAALDHETVPTLWPSGTFKLGSSALDDLVQKSSEVDFAVFVFTPDDVANIRKEELRVVRDNVLFELGIFIGALGKTRCFIVSPRDTDMHMPTDLIGVNATSYAADRPDNDVSSAVNYPCTKIQEQMSKLGKISRVSAKGGSDHIVANPPVWKMRHNDHVLLAECASASMTYPAGVGFELLGRGTNLTSVELGISATKLLKLGYVEKTVELDPHREEAYYSYTITEDGMDALIAEDERQHNFDPSTIVPAPRAPRSGRPAPAPTFADMDDTPPF